jgi:hypothetical protein
MKFAQDYFELVLMRLYRSKLPYIPFVLFLVVILTNDNALAGSLQLAHEKEGARVESSNESAFSMEFPKRKKKQKGSSKMKRHNRSMGKKFKRKNDDSLRDRR